jgi:PTS system nitrogen regulatory IIA component
MIDVRASNKRLLLQEFAAKAAVSLGLRVDQVEPHLLKREELGSTGIGGGILRSAKNASELYAAII